MRSVYLLLMASVLLALSACQDSSDNQAGAKPAIEKLPQSAFKDIEWTDLMPKEDFEALSNPPAYLSEIEDGSPEDQISSQMASAIEIAADDRYQQALVSTKVVEEMNGQPVRIPGFVVPLEFDEDRAITEFFLVPFFGACIHVPPPPPNQIVFIKSPEGFREKELYNPFWFSGVLKTTQTVNEIATATYSMEMQYFEPYSDAQ